MKRFDVTKETYSVDELAVKLDVSGTAVRMWLRDGTIRGIKVKRRWFIPAEEVHKILAQAAERGTSKGRKHDYSSRRVEGMENNIGYQSGSNARP